MNFKNTFLNEFLFSCGRWLTEQAKAALSPDTNGLSKEQIDSARKLRRSTTLQAYYTSWIQYYELFKISEAHGLQIGKISLISPK
jgi:hypothetical protein